MPVMKSGEKIIQIGVKVEKVAGCRLPVSSYRFQAPGYKLQGASCRVYIPSLEGAQGAAHKR